MPVLKTDDKTLNGSHEHFEHHSHGAKEAQKGPAGTIDQVLAHGIGADVSNEDRAAALKIAREADPGPAFNSVRYFRFILLALVACVCSGDNGERYWPTDRRVS